jgi:RNA polymerase sigma-70 factor (ECF subfamily)
MSYSLDQYPSIDRTPHVLADPTDEELMEQIKQGDEKALECLQRRHSKLMRTIISRITSNDHEIDELVQECLLQVWQRAGTYAAERGRALGWIVTMVRRRAIDRIRRKLAYQDAQDRLRAEAATVCEDHHFGADKEVVQSERAEIVARLIERLPAAQQEAVRLTFYEGMSQRQIAAHTGIPLGTIKTRLELAMRKLRSAALAFGELQEEKLTRIANVIPFPSPTVSWPEAA